MQSQFISAINQICEEKNIPKDIVIETVEAALAAAYKKDYGEKDQEVRVKLNEETGEIKAYVTKTVVEEVEDPFLEIKLEDAKKINKNAKLEETVEIEDTPTDFGRIAAQTAKQVIIQRIREAERDIVFSEYKDKEGELVNASVQRIEGTTVIVDLGQASGVLFSNEQVNGERYYVGQRIKVYIVKVEQSSKGPQVVVSRSHPGVIKKLFEMEVPEIEAGLVIIKAIAREAGFRTKIAVASAESNIDPVGSCVGQKGIRVQAVQGEIGQEKIDVIPFSEDAKEFITNALSPAKVLNIDLNEEEKKANVQVKEDQLSLAIGKSGQNVRLAAKLTGWGIDINVGEGEDTKAQNDTDEGAKADPTSPEATMDKEESVEKASEDQPAKETADAKVQNEEIESAKAEEDSIEEIVENEAEKVQEEVTEETPEESVEEILENEPVETNPTETETTSEEPAAEPVAEEPKEETANAEEQNDINEDAKGEPQEETPAPANDEQKAVVEEEKTEDELAEEILDENDQESK